MNSIFLICIRIWIDFATDKIILSHTRRPRHTKSRAAATKNCMCLQMVSVVPRPNIGGRCTFATFFEGTLRWSPDSAPVVYETCPHPTTLWPSHCAVIVATQWLHGTTDSFEIPTYHPAHPIDWCVCATSPGTHSSHNVMLKFLFSCVINEFVACVRIREKWTSTEISNHHNQNSGSM